jgi:glycosyltransferase involved in cell wall biosynthesis
MGPQRSKPKAFIASAYAPYGGTYMNYHVGLALHERHGLECVVVDMEKSSPDPVFDYPVRFDSIDLATMERSIGPDDLLFSSPVYSPQLLGLRVKARKVMYMQHFITAPVLDGFFDHYVSVSKFVSRHYELVCGLTSPVIGPFIHVERIPAGVPWDDRIADEVLVIGKVLKEFRDVSALVRLFSAFTEAMRERHPSLPHRFRLVELEKNRVPHRELLSMMAQYRYLVVLSPAEGFGLMPLEGMAAGCTLAGFHGCGGLDYMRPGFNCEVVGYPRMDLLADCVARILGDESHARRLAHQGRQDAQGFTLARFQKNWEDYFNTLL